MNFQYKIKYNDKPFIEIIDRKLLSLQELLNTINVYPYIEKVIDEFKVVRQQYPDLEELIENKYNGYWEDDELGKCFSILGYEYVCAFIDKNNAVYIENEYQYPEVPRVKMSMDEFINTLESWRDILKLYFESQP